MIKDGILQVNEINGTPVVIDLIPTNNKTSRPQITMIPKYLTIHNTGNSNAGADATANSNYAKNTSLSVSWHFTIDDKEIVQILPITETSWNSDKICPSR